MPRRLVLALLVIVAASAAGGWWLFSWSASASSPSPWPGDEIVYSDKSGWGKAVRAAVWQWNTAGVGIRFRKARAGESADLMILADDRRVAEFCGGPEGPCIAFASAVGYREGQASEVVLPTRHDDGERVASHEEIRLLVHELGHILGLDHRRGRCESMNPAVSLRHCSLRMDAYRSGRRFCGPLAPDVKSASALYHGEGRERPYCL